jgi:hypothetical protein
VGSSCENPLDQHFAQFLVGFGAFSFRFDSIHAIRQSKSFTQWVFSLSVGAFAIFLLCFLSFFFFFLGSKFLPVSPFPIDLLTFRWSQFIFSIYRHLQHSGFYHKIRAEAVSTKTVLWALLKKKGGPSFFRAFVRCECDQKFTLQSHPILLNFGAKFAVSSSGGQICFLLHACLVLSRLLFCTISMLPVDAHFSHFRRSNGDANILVLLFCIFCPSSCTP